MKLSKLIERLKTIETEAGDLDVKIWTDATPEPVELAGVVSPESEDNIKSPVLLCDAETIGAFA